MFLDKFLKLIIIYLELPHISFSLYISSLYPKEEIVFFFFFNQWVSNTNIQTDTQSTPLIIGMTIVVSELED